MWPAGGHTAGESRRKEQSKMDTVQTDALLPPIEKPQGLIMKIAYAMARRQFGKVVTPIKVHSARLPVAFGLWYAKIGKLDKQLELPPELACLIHEG